MQIPPLDLGRVEVIKGVASSMYGAGAMGGVVNLVSRRPGTTPERQLLLNRSTRGATDAGFWYAAPLSDALGHDAARERQRSGADRRGRRWLGRPAEVHARLVVRPRLFWDDHAGRTFFATAGGTWEDRTGGSMPGTVAAGGGRSVRRSARYPPLGHRRGFQALAASGLVLSARGSWTSQRQDHEFGEHHRARSTTTPALPR